MQEIKSSLDENANISLESTDLSHKTCRCLAKVGIKTLKSLTKASEKDLLKIRNIGKKSLEEIKGVLSQHGLKLSKNNLINNKQQYINKGVDRDIYEEHIVTKTMDLFQDVFPIYDLEARLGQEHMAIDVAEAADERKHLMIEGGVGIGKSYAYIIPMMFLNRMHGKPIIISTSSISLQEQLVGDISKISTLVGYSPDVTIAKGMKHFLCKKRADDFLKKQEDAFRYNWLKNLIEDDLVGDRARLEPINQTVWDKINISNCSFLRCVYYHDCGFIEMRQAMRNTDGFIICNHDLLIVDAMKRKKNHHILLPSNIGYVVIDEAHGLEEKTRNALTLSYNKASVRRLMDNTLYFLESIVKNSEIDSSSYSKNISHLSQEIFKIVSTQIKEASTDYYENQKCFFEQTPEIIALLNKLFQQFKPLLLKVETANTNKEDIQENVYEEIVDFLDFIASISNKEDQHIFWLEYPDNLCRCPKHLDRIIYDLLFETGGYKCILTSATIVNDFGENVEENYSHFIKSIGYPAKTDLLAPPQLSPFPYDTNALLYYKNGAPHPTNEKDAFLEKVSEYVLELLHITQGKSLVLFTAKSDMELVFEQIQGRAPWLLLKQQTGSSQDVVINQFKDNVDSVLFGTGLFWEGIDIKGESLSNLIIVKLPFPVPDPVLEYKSNLTQDKYAVYLAEMIIRLRQGVGRLIRSMDDTGIVSILDPRIGDNYKSPYKEKVWDVLQIKQRTSNIKDVESFVNNHNIVCRSITHS